MSLIDEYKPANIEAMAKSIYAKQCDYVGADHEGECIKILSEALQSFEDQIKRAMDDLAKRDELISHCWVHDGYENCGYMQMTTEQKHLFDSLTINANEQTN